MIPLISVRVYPDITLKKLRSELGILLGTDRRIDKFSFLKCVGRSLALVSTAGLPSVAIFWLIAFHQANNVKQFWQS